MFPFVGLLREIHDAEYPEIQDGALVWVLSEFERRCGEQLQRLAWNLEEGLVTDAISI